MQYRKDIVRILRILQMEQIFDSLTALYEEGKLCLTDYPQHREYLYTLIRYYESPLWKQDYEADERGELPKDLKRGVLSQDGLYDFFTELQPLLGERKDSYDQ